MSQAAFIRRLTAWGLLPLALLFVTVEWLLRAIPNDYTFKNDWLSTHATNVAVLVLGSSHTYFGIDPSAVPPGHGRWFNAAHTQQTLRYDAFVLEKFLPQMTHLHTVILPVSYHTLWYRLNDRGWGDGAERIPKYRHGYGCRHYSPLDLKRSCEFFSLDLGAAARRVARHRLRGVPEIYCTATGFGKGYLLRTRDRDWDATGPRDAARHNEWQSNREALDENVRMLNEIADLCRRRDVRLLLLTPPAWRSYREALKPEQLADLRAVCTRTVRNNPHVRWLDLLDDARFGADDFFDATHMNEVGARRLTELLADAVAPRVATADAGLF